MADAYLYVVLGIAVPLLLALVPLMVRRPRSVAIFGIIGALVAVYVFLGVGSDGDITVAGSVNAIPISSDTIGSDMWTAVTMVPGFMAVLDCVMAISRAFF